MGQWVYLNGKLVERGKAAVSVFDHGVLYGDGVFEGIRAYNKRVFKLDEHVNRLYESAKIIMLDIPIDQNEMKRAILNICKANGIIDGYIRPVVTRGAGTLGLAPWKCKNPAVFVIADKVKLYPQEYYDNGMPMITASTRRNISEAVNPMAKSLNYLNNILAKIEAHNAGVEEAIMLNHQGFVAECTGDNIFMVKGNKLFTPPIYAGVLLGITRATVISLAADMGYETIERQFTRAELFLADEAFLTGTAAEVVPIVKVDGRVVGDGKPGPISVKLVLAFKDYAGKHGTPIE